MKTYLMYVCSICGKESKIKEDIELCEANHMGLDNLDDYYVWKRLAASARNCTGTRCISNNDNTRDAEDKSYELLDQFEKGHNLNAEVSVKLG